MMGEPDLSSRPAVVERLSREDTRILKLERGAIRGHTCKVIVLERSGEEPLPTLEEIRGHVSARLDHAVRLRQRVVQTPMRVSEPVWVDDHEFDIEWHVRAVTDFEGGGTAGLEAVVAELMTERLERSRPLWRLDVMPRLGEDSMALIWRIHHCLADGTTSMRLGSSLLWCSEPEPPAAPVGVWSPQAQPGTLDLLARGLADLGRRRARALVPMARAPAPEARVRLGRGALARELARRASVTPLARHAGSRRVVAFASVPLREARLAAKAIDPAVTVNDVVLAIIAGGVRTWLGRGLGPPGGIRVKIPVSLHRAEEGELVGNRDSYFFVDLPVAESDVVKRVLTIHQETVERKLEHDAEMLYRLGLHPFVNRWAMSPRVFTFNVSNVRGPDGELYVLGARVREFYSLAEIAEQHALRVAVISAAGRLAFGLCADADAVPELELLKHGIERAADELLVRAGSGG